MKLERRSPGAATNENTGLQSGFENGMLKPSKTQITPAMSEFKYACPVCGQHMKCDSSQSGTVMECPTCFQKITAPQAPKSDDPKFIITGTKVGERPIPTVVADSGAATPPEKHFPALVFVFVVLLFAAVAAAFVFRGKNFKSTSGQTNQIASASNGKQMPPPAPPKPIVGLACAIFAKGDSIVLGAGTNEAEVKDPAQASFLAAFKADLARPLPFEEPLPLTTTLPGFGREVPGATGEIRHHDSFPGGLVIGVTLAGLVPNHKYILTINGAIQHAGNNNLPEQLTRNNPQKYFDFSPAMTDENGRYQGTFGIRLPPGPYDVYFFVKDTADWKIILSHSLFQFTVE
jgi:DNA-directed RNA polymerase subunit RPC12/RpoP